MRRAQEDLLAKAAAAQQAAAAAATTSASPGLLSSVFGRGPAPVEAYASAPTSEADDAPAKVTLVRGKAQDASGNLCFSGIENTAQHTWGFSD